MITHMEKILLDLIANGFVIRPEGEHWVVEKFSIPSSPWQTGPFYYDICEKAVFAAKEKLQEFKTKEILEWVAVVRYNRGLGIEYKNLSIIQAGNPEEAMERASTLAIKELGDVDIKEIKVKPKH